MGSNLMRIKRERGEQCMAAYTWKVTQEVVEEAGVHIWAASDTGLEDGSSPG